MRSIDFAAINSSPYALISASSAATITEVGTCFPYPDCICSYTVLPSTTTTTVAPINFTLTPYCTGSGVNGTGTINVNTFTGGNGTYQSIAIGTTAGNAFSATPINLSGASSYEFTGLFNGTYHIILRDGLGVYTIKNTNVNCINVTSTTSTTSTSTSTTSTTTAAINCNYNGGTAVMVYTTTTSTSTSTTAAPTSTTSTTSTTTEAPTTTSTSTTTTTTAAPAGSFTVKNTSGSGQIDDVTTTGGAYFYLFNTGAFPLTSGQQADAGGASLTGADIFVDISNYSSTSCLSLYINGGLSGQLEVSANGTYTFTNKTFTTGDVVLIEYVSGICP
jgi:hypothetical protein